MGYITAVILELFCFYSAIRCWWKVEVSALRGSWLELTFLIRLDGGNSIQSVKSATCKTNKRTDTADFKVPWIERLTNFWPYTLKNHRSNFWLSWTCISMQKKINLFHLFILEIQPILDSLDWNGHNHSWLCLPRKFEIIFKFLWIGIDMTKSQAISSICSGDRLDL